MTVSFFSIEDTSFFLTIPQRAFTSTEYKSDKNLEGKVTLYLVPSRLLDFPSVDVLECCHRNVSNR